jgi:hypothetical protein
MLPACACMSPETAVHLAFMRLFITHSARPADNPLPMTTPHFSGQQDHAALLAAVRSLAAPSRCRACRALLALVSLTLALLPLLWPMGAWASGRQDHEQAREALARGQVMPLKSVLDQLARQRPGGHILEVELERSDGRWIYEIKQMDASGRLVKLKLDAQTGLLLTPFKDTP